MHAGNYWPGTIEHNWQAWVGAHFLPWHTSLHAFPAVGINQGRLIHAKWMGSWVEHPPFIVNILFISRNHTCMAFHFTDAKERLQIAIQRGDGLNGRTTLGMEGVSAAAGAGAAGLAGLTRWPAAVVAAPPPLPGATPAAAGAAPVHTLHYVGADVQADAHVQRQHCHQHATSGGGGGSKRLRCADLLSDG